jgi:hypothetical protein
MGQHQTSPEKFRRAVLAYHYLPVVASLALVGIFLGVFFFAGSFVLSGMVAGLSSAFLVWRWALAGKQIDRLGCLKCGEPLPVRTSWTFPPKVCPRCGERLR